MGRPNDACAAAAPSGVVWSGPSAGPFVRAAFLGGSGARCAMTMKKVVPHTPGHARRRRPNRRIGGSRRGRHHERHYGVDGRAVSRRRGRPDRSRRKRPPLPSAPTNPTVAAETRVYASVPRNLSELGPPSPSRTGRRQKAHHMDDAAEETDLPRSLQATWRANNLLTFHAMVTRFHSPFTLSSPRKCNCRKPTTDLMTPNTSSEIRLRRP